MALQPPKPLKTPLDENGQQNVLGKRLTPEAGLDELRDAKKNGRLPCWALLEPKLVHIDKKQPSQGVKAMEHLIKFLAIRGCPSHIEDPHLKAAFQALGCTLISK
ncbi:hypothetical protein OEZ85_013709 [Tetradesmus obliquus]|uniref:Uncharacterized protein n=1 Tax=Tetradesmus obliquus TaxID=3088 RepID=A0ABY8UT25_TETOB|nr:hypothetical protein OEZ85_013709 [Tetradesmus obliquus]